MLNMDTIKYASCRRSSLLMLTILQLASTLEKQVFDFFGHLWAPVIGNFLHIIIVIMGICGVCRLNIFLIIMYAAWNLLWLAWNTFIVCLYLQVGTLSRDSQRDMLTLGTDGKGWWLLEHGLGCQVINSSEDDQVLVSQGSNSSSEVHPVGCRVQYYYVEVIHAAIQCLLTLLGLLASWMCICCMKKDRGDLAMASGNSQHPNLNFTFPFQVVNNRKLHGTLPHTRTAHHSTGTENFDFHLPSLPHIAFPHSPDYPLTPKYHQNSKVIDPMLNTNVKTSARPKTPSLQMQALKNSFSNLFMLNHYMCSTFFSYPASKRARLGAQSHCSDENIFREDQTEYMPIIAYRNENNLGKPAPYSSQAESTNDDVELDDDIWILQTEL